MDEFYKGYEPNYYFELKDKNRFESIFTNFTDSEFEDILKDCGFKFKKVDKNKGGLFIAVKE